MKHTAKTGAFICLIILVLSGILSAQTHFSPPQGNPFLPMTIYIIGAKTFDGQNIVAGTEIGVFGKSRADICVGAAVLPGAVNPASPVQLIASKEDGENNGFLEGDSMIFKLWDPAFQREHTLTGSEIQFYDNETASEIDPVTFSGLETAVIEIVQKGYIDVTSEPEIHGPESFRLFQNYPNPFNPSTLISYEVPEDAEVRIEVFNVQGVLVCTLFKGKQKAGIHSIEWDAANAHGHKVTSGIYFLRMNTAVYTECKKILFAK